jgi:phage RecT family recombinase
MTKEQTSIQKIEAILLDKLPQFYNGNANKYIKSVLLEIAKSKMDSKKDLSNCSPLSILTAVKQAVDLGLEIDSRQHCHLVKRNKNVGTKDKPKWIEEVQLQVGYRGYLYKIKEYYPDVNFVVGLVRAGDVFSINKADESDSFTHKEANPFDSNLASIVGGYCYITYTLGGRKISKIITMSKQEINKIKDVAKTKDIWDTWFEEKAKVAIIRRACKIIFAGLTQKLDEFNNDEFDLNKPKQEPIIINDLPPADVEPETIEQPEVKNEGELTTEEIEAINKAEAEDLKNNEYKRAKDGE